MTVINYQAKNKGEKWIIMRYIFKNEKFEESFWVNTYYTKKDALNYLKQSKETYESDFYKANKTDLQICENTIILRVEYGN